MLLSHLPVRQWKPTTLVHTLFIAEAVNNISQAWQLFSQLHALYAEAGTRGVFSLDSAGYPAAGSRLVPGTTLPVVAGPHAMFVETPSRFAECHLLEQVC